MSDPRPEYEAAVKAQRMAADPTATRLVSANAGSGKTKVLVDRVTGLLWQGVEPHKILCLTYTKAAASEMQSRLFAKLGLWSVMSEADLNDALNALQGQSIKRSTKRLRVARQLFARALESPDGLRIQTIHAFCDRVLSRFPIEAGILPGFNPLDDGDILNLREAVEAEIYHKAYHAPDGDLAQALSYLATHKSNQVLSGLFRWMASNGPAIQRWQEGGGITHLANHLNVRLGDTPESVKAKAWRDGPLDTIRSAAQALQNSPGKTDIKNAEIILNLFTSDADPAATFNIYSRVFLTQAGSLRKGVVGLKAPEIAASFFGTRDIGATRESDRILATLDKAKSAQVLAYTEAIYKIAESYHSLYTRKKRSRRGLDFNDQINFVRQLVMETDRSDWIRYKLDGGIDHILLDEAQDTAPEQWDIIDTLKSHYAQPDSDKTFFAVGDEKQSIYSFQGAEPEEFINRIQTYVIDPDAEAIRMQMSFRSSPDILRIVDAVFEDQRGIEQMFNPARISASENTVTHSAHREDRGRVELWPLSPKPIDPPEEVPWDTRPVNATDQASSREKLAAAIADHVDRWLKNKEPIYDREINETRPMQAGDILILVRSRTGGFFDAIIRNLKQAQVPVAGSDRLVLKDSMAVKDLLALTRFVLLPADDLSLAEVLKSPIIGFSEDELFDIAFDRDATLWQSLKAAEFPSAHAAVRLLETARKTSREYAPYEFYARILDLISETTRQSVLKNIYGRLGIEAKDAIEAFLSRALTHQRRGAPSLQHFLQDFQSDDQDIKRDMNTGSSEVRVMTVHGAKGLEAPVVILPDTTRAPKPRNRTGIVSVDKGYAYLSKQSDVPVALMEAYESINKREREEYMRLLYVAMTRAESRLVICGFKIGRGEGNIDENCWYENIKTAMSGLDTTTIETPFEDGLMFGSSAKSVTAPNLTKTVMNINLEPWMTSPAPEERELVMRKSPSRLLSEHNDSPSPSPVDSLDTIFQRGNIIHKLLEILPDRAMNERIPVANNYISQFKMLDHKHRQDILDNVFRVLDNPDYAHIFAPGSRAEVSLAGQVKSLPDVHLRAQIDRLVITDQAAYIIDYKSNRNPPQKPDDVPDIYLGQMAAYRDMVQDLYPNKTIICALLWTEGPDLMMIGDDMLDATLTQYNTIPT